MKCRLIAISLALATSQTQAVDASRLMPDLAWEQRVLLIFSPDHRHADYHQQVRFLDEVEHGLQERDLTVIETFADDRITIAGQAAMSGGSSFYRRFSVAYDEFRVILVGKDGTIKLERNSVVDSTVLFALIDAMPMRRLEMQGCGGAGNRMS